MTIPRTDFDGAWKEFIEEYFEPFLKRCFPSVHARIDWAKPVIFLNQELVDLIRDAELGKQQVDKLVKVNLLTGEAIEILVHIEVQSQRDVELPLRLYQYHFRIQAKHNLPVVTLAVLADDNPTWHPQTYREDMLGCRLTFEFLTCKLTDFDGPELLKQNDPASLVIAAHLGAMRTAKDLEARVVYKIRLIRCLLAAGLDKGQITRLFAFVDWLMVLPKEKAVEFRRELRQLEQEKNMPYITSIERLAKEEGWQEGRQEGRQEGFLQARRVDILAALEARFGSLPQALRERVQSVTDESALHQAFRTAITAPSLEQFLRAI